MSAPAADSGAATTAPADRGGGEPRPAGSAGGRDLSAPSSQRGFLRSARVVSLLTLVSRVLGLLRDAVMASVLGAGAVNDALTFAWTLPNNFRRLFGEGALSTAFVPVFSRVLERDGRAAAGRLMCQLVTGLGLLLLGLAGAMSLAAGLLPDGALALLTGADQLDKARLTVAYAQLLLPYLAVICVIAQFMAVLNVLDEYAVPAMAPVLLNLVWLAGAGAAAWWGLSGDGGFAIQSEQGYVVVGAILLAGAVQFAWHLPALRRRELPFRLSWPRLSPELRAVAAGMAPLALAMGASQINVLVDRAIAMSALPDGGTTHLYLGLRVQQFPMGLVTVALATTAYPAMSRLMAQADRRGAVATASQALRTNLLVTLPATAGLVVLARPIVELLFQGGRFDSEDSRLTAQALAGYAWGIPFSGSVMLLQRACYAADEQRLPLRTALAMVPLNIVLALVLVGPLGGLGLALATSITAAVWAAWLLLGVGRRVAAGSGERLLSGLLPSVTVSGVMALVVWAVDAGLAGAVPPGRFGAGLRVLAGMASGLLIFLLAAPRLCPREWLSLSQVWRRQSPPAARE